MSKMCISLGSFLFYRKALVTGTPVTSSCAIIPAVAMIARRPLFSSLVRMLLKSDSVFGFRPRGSKPRSPGVASALRKAVRALPVSSGPSQYRDTPSSSTAPMARMAEEREEERRELGKDNEEERGEEKKKGGREEERRKGRKEI
jgi:hypothetical protein